MSSQLIQSDIVIMRKRYNEALTMQGIPCKYQFPNIADTNTQGESVVDAYSEFIDTYIFFESTPKVKTLKRYGWVVENSDDLPFLLHCSWDLPKLQKDCLFRISGMYSELPERIFRVSSISYDLQAPDHLVATVVPVYDENVTGRTRKEVETTFNSSNHFLKQDVDYRGNVYTTKEDIK